MPITASLEALKAFTQGEALHSAQGEDLASIPFYQRAIELDPNFALAYGRLGTVYANLSQLEIAGRYLKQAMDRRERASERERLYIEAHYYDSAGQIERIVQKRNWLKRMVGTWGLELQTSTVSSLAHGNKDGRSKILGRALG